MKSGKQRQAAKVLEVKELKIDLGYGFLFGEGRSHQILRSEALSDLGPMV